VRQTLLVAGVGSVMKSFDRRTYSTEGARSPAQGCTQDERPDIGEYCMTGDVLRVRSDWGPLSAVTVFKRAR
jgi:hypothetical protein